MKMEKTVVAVTILMGCLIAPNLTKASESSLQYAVYLDEAAGQNHYSEISLDASSVSRPEYLCSISTTDYLDSDDIEACTPRLLNYMRNEIFARHGRQFNSQELMDYFNSKSWYSGTISPDSFSTSVFNQQELANIQTLYAREQELCPGGYALDAAGYDIEQIYADWIAAYGDSSANLEDDGEWNQTTSTYNEAAQTISDDQIQLMKQGQIVELGSEFWLDLDQDGENEYVKFVAEDEYLNEISQDYYRMSNYNIESGNTDEYYAVLKKQLKLYSAMNLESGNIILEPQRVGFPYTDNVEWVYVKGESGMCGWLWMGDMEDISVKMEYFDGLFFAD